MIVVVSVLMLLCSFFVQFWIQVLNLQMNLCATLVRYLLDLVHSLAGKKNQREEKDGKR